MSFTISTVPNYGGIIPGTNAIVKQFIVSAGSQTPTLTYKTVVNGLKVQTPTDNKTPFYIATDLYVQGTIHGFHNLDISGNALIRHDLYVNGHIYNSSDERLKENIEAISAEKTEKLFDLKPVEYQFKNDDDAKHYGFIAQQVEEIFPDLVKTNDLGYKTVNYIEIIPILLSKMKNMQKDMDELKKCVETIMDQK